ncbi:MAG: SDR family NAD(P)-dependent oxidoreductase [Nanoarchaeota archaeon]
MVVLVLKRVLITGGAGFIGFHLARNLANQEYDVTIADNLFRGKMDSELKNLISNKNVSFIQCDLTKIKDLKKLGYSYDYVYHLASINGTKYFYEIPHIVLKVNMLCAINILDWFLNNKNKNKKILFSSSSETYAGTLRRYGIKIPTREDVPLTIEDVKNPRWSYGGSKIIGELLFTNYAKKNNFRMSIVRYHNIYGERMGFEHVIPQFCLRILDKEIPFKIFGGTETRAFCYFSDAIRATQMVMEEDGADGEIINIGNSDEEITMKDLAIKLFKISKVNPKLYIKKAPKGSVTRRCPNISKLNRLTGFTPKVNLDEGLKKTFEWYKEYHNQ